ncbi:hypothetical protein [Rhodopila sp.]|uniref:hypothetical protein n=1 Tax=Rhodopila sp. TaxID=2480087 RepID=UPI003D109144
MGAATAALGWSGYVTSLLHNLGVSILPALAAAPGTAIKLPDDNTVTGILNQPAAALVAILTTMLIMGTKGPV